MGQLCYLWCEPTLHTLHRHSCCTSDVGQLYIRRLLVIHQTLVGYSAHVGWIYFRRWSVIQQTLACYTSDVGLLYIRRWPVIHQALVGYTSDVGLLYIRPCPDTHQTLARLYIRRWHGYTSDVGTVIHQTNTSGGEPELHREMRLDS